MEVVAFVGPSGTGKSHHAIGVAFDNRCDAIIDDGLLIKGTKILAGTYPPGGHLDSVRDLAAAAGVNPNTMQRALAQLETEGLVRTERTAGRFVTEDTALIEQLRADTAQTLAADFLEKMRGIGYSPAQAAALLEHWDAKENRDE